MGSWHFTPVSRNRWLQEYSLSLIYLLNPSSDNCPPTNQPTTAAARLHRVATL